VSWGRQRPVEERRPAQSARGQRLDEEWRNAGSARPRRSGQHQTRTWRPYAVTRGDGGSGCSDVGERSPEAVAALSDWGCQETTALDSGGWLQTSFKGVRHPGRSARGAPGVRCRLTGGPVSASPPLTSGPRTSAK
jgi:hypothetical protein